MKFTRRKFFAGAAAVAVAVAVAAPVLAFLPSRRGAVKADHYLTDHEQWAGGITWTDHLGNGGTFTQREVDVLCLGDRKTGHFLLARFPKA